MKKTQNIIWVSLLFVIVGALIVAVLLYLSKKDNSLPVIDLVRRDESANSTLTEKISGVISMDGPAIPVSLKGTAPHGLTLQKAIELFSENRNDIFAIRSFAGIYPDGTSDNYEVLYRKGTLSYRAEININGMHGNTVIEGSIVNFPPLPKKFPDSNEALEQLTANPYFSKATTNSIALFYDEYTHKWSYLVRTNLGDVNIIVPKAK